MVKHTTVFQFISPRTISYLHISSCLYQCLHLITACFMCVFHSLKHLPTKLKINNRKKPPPKPAQPAATSSSKPFPNTPAGLRLLRPVPKSAMLVRIAIGGVVGLLIFLICWWVPWHANGVNVEPFATMGVSEACALEKACLPIGQNMELVLM